MAIEGEKRNNRIDSGDSIFDKPINNNNAKMLRVTSLSSSTEGMRLSTITIDTNDNINDDSNKIDLEKDDSDSGEELYQNQNDNDQNDVGTPQTPNSLNLQTPTSDASQIDVITPK